MPTLIEGGTAFIPLKYHNFDRMPGAFVIFVGPDRNTKWSKISGGGLLDSGVMGNGDSVAASSGATSGWKDKLMSSRKDKLLSIRQLRLSVNTRSDAFISTRGDSISFDKMQLYFMTMKNIRRYNLGFSEYPMTLTQWYENFCCVILTVDDISAAIPSANVTSRVNIHGRIEVENNMGYSVNGPDFAPGNGYGNAGGDALPQEKYQAMIYSVYNNRGMVLTQTGGEPLTEILPASFATELKLGGRAQYVGRV